MTLSYAPYPRAVAGSLRDVGLGALTYPSWIPQTCVNCSSSTLERWKTQIAFAMGWYDIFRNLEKFPTAAQAERFKRFGTYGKPELAMDPNNAFWASTPERVADHADIVKQALRHGSFHSSTSFTPGAAITNLVKGAAQTAVDAAGIPITIASVGKIPVLGDIVNIVGEAAVAPYKLAAAVASGERLDHALVGALKDQLKIVKDVAPYAQTVVSMMPGIGSGVAAALGTGIALAEGQNITAALKSGVRNAIPGGPLVQAGFDAALKVASGENVGKVALEEVRSQLSPQAQKAFDVGLAVVTGEKIQTALANGLASLAPAQIQTLVAAGKSALTSTPGLADAIKSVAAGDATKGFQIAAGLLSSAGMNEKALTAARNGLPASVRQGFDAALKTQEGHIAWLKNVTGASAAPAATPAPAQLRTLDPPKRPAAAPAPAPLKTLDPPKRPAAAAAPAPLKTLDPPKKAPAAAPAKTVSATVVAPGAFVYAPYPKNGALGAPPPHGGHGGGHHGGGHGGGHARPFARGGGGGRGWYGGPWNYEVVTTVETCRTWGDPIDMMPVEMLTAVRTVLGTSGGRPTTVRGPDGVFYLIAIEGKAVTARPCIAS